MTVVHFIILLFVFLRICSLEILTSPEALPLILHPLRSTMYSYKHCLIFVNHCLDFISAGILAGRTLCPDFKST